MQKLTPRQFQYICFHRNHIFQITHHGSWCYCTKGEICKWLRYVFLNSNDDLYICTFYFHIIKISIPVCSITKCMCYLGDVSKKHCVTFDSNMKIYFVVILSFLVFQHTLGSVYDELKKLITRNQTIDYLRTVETGHSLSPYCKICCVKITARTVGKTCGLHTMCRFPASSWRLTPRCHLIW